MSNNKLYTEEQVKLMIDDAHNGVDGYYDILKKHNPIKLPSDEEICEEADSLFGPDPQDFAFYRGAIWMRDKIQGGNK
jgi:hypothetical protein